MSPSIIIGVILGLERTKLIKIFLEYNFNIAADALDYILQKKVSEDILRERIIKIPQDIPVVRLTTVEKYLDPLERPNQHIKREIQDELDKSEQVKSGTPETVEIDNEEITKSTIPTKITQKMYYPTPTAYLSSLEVNIEKDIPERYVSSIKAVLLARYILQ